MLVEIPIEMLDQASKPTISQTQNNMYFIVSKTGNDKYKCLFLKEKHYRILTLNELKELWSGYCILMETNEESGEINGRIKEQKAQIFRVTNLLILISIIGIIIFGLFSVDKNIYAYILSLTGLMLSAFLLLKEKYFFENEIIDICKIGKRLDCDKVIHLDKSKIYGFSLAEISSGFFLFLVIGSVLNISFFSIVKPIIYL